MKRVKIWRKRNEKHKVKNKEDKKWKKCGQGELLLTRIIKNKENKFQVEKRNLFWTKLEKQREWNKRNEIFCGKRSKQKGNGKKKRNKQISQEKREMITKRKKQGDTQKGKREKRNEQEKTQQKEIKENEKWWKRRR